MPNDTDTDRAARCQKALQIAREADSFQAIAFLESRDDVLAIGQEMNFSGNLDLFLFGN